jgi:AcrR family transcriptional regulator
VAPRQRIGARKIRRLVRRRGQERRRLLLEAAYDLLCARPIEEIGFREIAKKAGVPEGSAYHFFANRFDVFTALANELSAVFVVRHQRRIPAARRRRWQDLAAHMIEVGACVYAENPPARQLLIGGKTPPEVKHADRINDRTVANVMYDVFSSCFDIPRTAQMRDAFYYFIEITDVIFTLSVIAHGVITPAMLAEAKRAGTGYLGTYLGNRNSRHAPIRSRATRRRAIVR